jgi:hypothetical protein
MESVHSNVYSICVKRVGGMAWDPVGKKTVNHTCIRNIYSGRDACIFTVILFLFPSLLSYIDEDYSTLLTSR